MTISFGGAAILVGGAYLLPKVLNYLTTRPEDDTSRLGKLRGDLADLRDELKEIAGEGIWFVVSKVVGENGWIGMLGLLFSLWQLKSGILISEAVLSSTCLDHVLVTLEKIEKGVVYAGIFLGCAGITANARTLLVAAYPPLGKFL